MPGSGNTLRTKVEALAGGVCIFTEKRWLMLVRILRAVADDWGATFQLEVQPAPPGFTPFHRASFDVAARWDCFCATDEYARGLYGGWTLIHRADDVDRIQQIALEHKDNPDLMEKVWAYLFEMEERQMVAGLKPSGPTAPA